MVRYLVPLAVFGLLVVLFTIGLGLNPREVPSPLIGRPAPAFSLPSLHEPGVSISERDLAGKVSVLNVFASWCVACRAEHPLLMGLAERAGIALYGLNYKDERDDALRWLRRFGDPYTAVAVDADGRAGIDWGVYGVPETFIVDRAGIVRHKVIGPIDAHRLERDILPLIRELKDEH